MEWVAKKYLLGGIFALAIAIYLAAYGREIFATSHPAEKIEPTFITCFDTATVTLNFQDQCLPSQISLGGAALHQEGDSPTVVNPLLAARFTAAKATASQQGIDLYTTSGFRTHERQAQLYAREVKIRGSETEAAKWVLPAAYSHHPLGLALDINYPSDPEGASWLEKNGWRFGLCRVYANEWWHFEGVVAPGQRCPAMAPNALVDLP